MIDVTVVFTDGQKVEFKCEVDPTVGMRKDQRFIHVRTPGLDHYVTINLDHVYMIETHA